MKAAAAASTYKFYDPSESDEVTTGCATAPVSASAVAHSLTGDRCGHFRSGGRKGRWMPDFVRGTDLLMRHACERGRLCNCSSSNGTF